MCLRSKLGKLLLEGRVQVVAVSMEQCQYMWKVVAVLVVLVVLVVVVLVVIVLVAVEVVLMKMMMKVVRVLVVCLMVVVLWKWLVFEHIDTYSVDRSVVLQTLLHVCIVGKTKGVDNKQRC